VMEGRMLKEPQISPVPWTVRDISKGMVVVIAFLVAIMVLTAVGSVVIALSLLGSETFLELGPEGVREYIASDDFVKYLVALSLLGTLALEGMLLLVVWRFAVAKYRCGWEALGFRHFNLRNALILILVVLSAGVLINYLYAVVVSLIGAESLEPPSQPSPLPFDYELGWASLSLLAFISLIAAPLAEETFFRGFIFIGIGKRFGYAWGAVLSALLFSLAHLQFGALVPIFLLGLLLAWLYARTGSLWTCILAHFTYNSIALLFMI
jgi:membrane protease YdiL (CAAX protease family)